MKTTQQKIKYHIDMIRRAIEEEPDQTYTMYCLWRHTDSMYELMTGKRFREPDRCVICPHCGKKVNK